MKKILTAVFALMMTASLASAQMHGPGPSNGMGNGMGGNGMDFGHGPDGGLLVASNGTIILTSMSFDSATRTATETIKAVGITGSVLWTQTLTNARGPLVLSGSNLISVNETVATDGTASATLTALSVATGATVWTKTVNGHVTDLTPFNGGTYAIVVIPATTSGGTASRSLVAIGNDGSILWSVTL